MEKIMQINMDGKTFIEYEKYKKTNSDFSTPKIQGLLIIIFSLSSLVLIPLIHEWFNPPPPIVWGTTMLNGIAVNNGLLVFIIVCIGIAWILHGFGFILVRR